MSEDAGKKKDRSRIESERDAKQVLSSRQRQVVQVLELHGPMPSLQLRDKTTIPKSSFFGLVRKMTERELLVRRKDGKSVYYGLPGQDFGRIEVRKERSTLERWLIQEVQSLLTYMVREIPTGETKIWVEYQIACSRSAALYGAVERLNTHEEKERIPLVGPSILAGTRVPGHITLREEKPLQNIFSGWCKYWIEVLDVLDAPFEHPFKGDSKGLVAEADSVVTI